MSTKKDFLQKNIDFDTKNKEVLDWLEFFDPEPVVLSFAKEHLPSSKVIRVIKWQSLSRSGVIKNHFDHQEWPFRHSTSLVRDQITAVNFEHYLKDGQALPQNLHNFTINEFSWLVHTSTVKDQFAPPMAPKRHNEGVQIVLKDDHLTATYLSFSIGIGLSPHNKTSIVPVTIQNFESVLMFLKGHMEKNKNNV